MLFMLHTGYGFADTALVAVASNFAEPARAIAIAFEDSTGVKPRLAFGSSGKFFAQISNGAPFDVFLSADQAKPLQLVQDGLALEHSRFTYAEGRLVLWSADPGFVKDAGRLGSGSFNRLAIANPALAPYGVAALDVLEQLDLLEATRDRWVMGENIAQAFMFVHSSNADIGFVAASQVVREGSIRSGSGWLVPAAMHRPILQDAVLLKQAAGNETARQFLAYLASPEAGTLIARYGYR